jgi:hypothetical protein
MSRAVLLGVWAVCCGAMLACGPTPGLRHARIHHAVTETNTRNEQAVLSRFLRAEHATLLEPQVEIIEDPGYLAMLRESRGLGVAPTPQRGRRHALRIVTYSGATTGGEGDLFLGMNWETFIDAMREDRLVEGMTARGEPVILRSTETNDERGPVRRYFARARDGRLLLLETVRRSVRRHRIVHPYSCDLMPTFEMPPESWPVLVVEGHRVADLKRITLRYEGEEIAYACASYTY